MSSTGFSWANAAINALSSFDSSNVPAQHQLPITLPQSTYDPNFSSPSFFDFVGHFSEPSRLVNHPSHHHHRRQSSFENANHHQGRTYDNAEYTQNQQRDLWGGFALNQGFAPQLQTQQQLQHDSYAPAADQDMSFQYIRMPSRNALPIVPIYDNNVNSPSSSSYMAVVAPGSTPTSSSMLQPDLLRSSNPNLYPQNAMPLTIKHPEFRQQQQQQGQQQTADDEAWAAHLMNNVMKLEHSNNVQSSAQQPPLTISHPYSHSHSQSQAQSQPHAFSQQQQPQQQHTAAQATQYTLEQIQYALMYQHQAQSANPNDPAPNTGTADSLSQILDQLTANIHDKVAASRLNSGAKEIATLPSAIPSVPSLHVRTPAPGVGARLTPTPNHPYTSPRFTPQSPRGGGNLRSIRPVSRGVKRESISLQGPAPTTTAYLAGLRRHVPLAELASERAPVEPYPRHGAMNLTFPLSIAHNGLNGNATMGSGSASTSPLSLPSDSPSSRMGSLSPKKEGGGMHLPNGNGNGNAIGIGQGDGGALRLMNHRQEPPRSGTGTTPPHVLLQSPQTSTNGADSLRSATRATAARKRADEDILQHSFRSDEDWRRRIVLEAVLSSTFVAENTLEPCSSSSGAGGGAAGSGGFTTSDDPLMTGVGDALAMGLGAPGKSVYAVFLEQVEKSEWRCLFGDKEHPCASQAVAFRRLERALDHVRSHLNHRPFGCRGECQKGDSCDARFFARSHLQDHVKRTESACCETCGQVIRIQNMPRHRMAH